MSDDARIDDDAMGERPVPDLSPDERQERMLRLLAGGRRLAVSDLARLFATSEDSIRRDVRALAAAGRVRRVHGAVLPAAAPPSAFPERGGERQAEKARIAAATLALLRDGSTILLDGGTTALALARHLPADLSLTVVTPSLPAADALAGHPKVDVLVIGGSLDRASRTTVGAAALRAVRDVRADLCILGPCGVDAESGVTATGFEEGQMKRAMAESSAAVIALATSDKVGPASRFHVLPAASLSRLVTGADADMHALSALAALGVEVLLA